ncbi:MAG: DUF5979 domain-containing protein, partial [Acidobacteriota bacterium]|nr:DUF5979 domain-containing protein [Acidobacteriota bacterium]
QPKGQWNAKNPDLLITETLDPNFTNFSPRIDFGYLCTFNASINPRGNEQGDLIISQDQKTASFTIEDLKSDQSVSCDIYNKHKTSTLKLVKKFVPVDGGDASKWQLTATATPVGAPTYDKPGNHPNFETVWANTVYTLDEDGPEGYKEGTWSCNKGTLDGDQLTIPVGVSEVTCEISNTLLRTVTLQKEWVNGAEGDTADLAITGGSNGAATSTANGDAGSWTDTTNQATATVGVGNTFTVGEELGKDNTGSYDDPTTVCKAGETVITAGDNGYLVEDDSDIVCTITNTRQTGSLLLVKEVPEPTGTLTPGKWTLEAKNNASPKKDYKEFGDNTEPRAVWAETPYTLSESPNAAENNYTAGDWSCEVQQGDDRVSAQVERQLLVGDVVTVPSNTTVVCTIVNKRDTAQLKLIKSVEGGKVVADKFLLTAEADATEKQDLNISTPGGSGEFKDVYAGTVYTLDETGPAGYTRGDWVCLPASEPKPTTNQVEGQLNDGDKITLKNRQRVECTIVNTRDLGSLKITKSFDPKTSGYDKAFDIGYKCENEAQGTVSLKAGQSETIDGIPTGTECQVTEVKPTDPPAGWSFSEPTFDPPSGKVKVTEKDKTMSVTVTNEILKPGINIVKTGSATQVNPGQTVTYTYTVTNTGDTDLLNVKVEDNKCSPVVYQSGDANNDKALQKSETWTYTCSQPINEATTNVATATGNDKNGLQVTAQDTFTVAVVSPVVNKKICPIKVTLVKPKPKKVGNRVLVKKIKTKKSSCKILKPVVLCRPLATTAAGEKAFCDTKVTKRGKIRVKTRGYDKVKVTVIVRSKPKKGFEDRYKPNTWRKSWILR